MTVCGAGASDRGAKVLRLNQKVGGLVVSIKQEEKHEAQPPTQKTNNSGFEKGGGPAIKKGEKLRL